MTVNIRSHLYLDPLLARPNDQSLGRGKRSVFLFHISRGAHCFKSLTDKTPWQENSFQHLRAEYTTKAAPFRHDSSHWHDHFSPLMLVNSTTFLPNPPHEAMTFIQNETQEAPATKLLENLSTIVTGLSKFPYSVVSITSDVADVFGIPDGPFLPTPGPGLTDLIRQSLLALRMSRDFSSAADAALFEMEANGRESDENVDHDLYTRALASLLVEEDNQKAVMLKKMFDTFIGPTMGTDTLASIWKEANKSAAHLRAENHLDSVSGGTVHPTGSAYAAGDTATHKDTSGHYGDPPAGHQSGRRSSSNSDAPGDSKSSNSKFPSMSPKADNLKHTQSDIQNPQTGSHKSVKPTGSNWQPSVEDAEDSEDGN